MKGLAKERIYISHRHKQQCGGSQREGGPGLGVGGQKRGNGDICNSVNNKNKVKKHRKKKITWD